MNTAENQNLSFFEERRAFGSIYLEIRIDTVPVSHLTLVFQTMRFGAATLRCAALEGVGTNETCRGKGYSRMLIEHAKGVMRREGATLAVVDGIPNFYHRFGYELVEPVSFVSLYHPKTALPNGAGGLRPFRSVDLASVQRLYDQACSESVGIVVRLEGDEAWSRIASLDSANTGQSLRVLEDSGGRVVAYAWRGLEFWKPRSIQSEGGHFLVAESAAATPAAAARLVEGCVAWAAESSGAEIGPFQHVVFYAHPHETVWNEVRVRKSRTYENFNPEGGYRAQVLESRGFFESLLPEFRRRVDSVGLTQDTALVVHTRAGDIGLTAGPTGIAIHSAADAPSDSVRASLSPGQLAQLAFGAFEPRLLCERWAGRPDAQAVDLLAALFPEMRPFTCPVDCR